MAIGLIFATIGQVVALMFLIKGDSAVGRALLCGCMIIIYGFYIIIDLKLITERLDLDDYILGAFTLYMDLMTLFVYILAALGNKK